MTSIDPKWKRIRARSEEECRLLAPVIESAERLHGHTTGSGDPLADAAELAEWLTWRVGDGWTIALKENGYARAFDRRVRDLAAAAVAEFENR